MIQRLLKKPSHHFILLGQRGVGKSFWLKQQFSAKESLYLDLLDYKLYKKLLKNPELLESIIEENPSKKWIIIDEFQKIPSLLNVVHRMIENSRYQFGLTGSSARKLKRGRSNLLAGRAFFFKMFSLSWFELKNKIKFDDFLFWGGLPKLYQLKNNEEKIDYLNSYTQLYIKEEVQQEQLIRKIDPFISFLEIAAQMNGKILNFSNISKDTNVDAKTIVSYYQILEETMLGFYLPAYDRSIRKRQKKSPKFYFLDLGVVRALENALEDKLRIKTSEYGRVFENFLVSEIVKINSYYKKNFKLSYFQDEYGEIDLVAEKGKSKTYLIEIKSSDTMSKDDAKNLIKYSSSFQSPICIVLSRDKISMKIENVHFYHWEIGLRKIFISESLSTS